MTTKYLWHGELEKGATPDTIRATLRDNFGYTITITGTKTATGYSLTGVTGPVPEWLKFPLLDDEG